MIHTNAAAKVQAAGGVRSIAFDATQRLRLASGENLAPLTIAFETYGALNAERTNAVLVCHDLTHDQFVASANPVTGRAPWWPRIVGPGRPIDTNRLYVICSNVLGGSMGSTGPASRAADGQPYALRFPAIGVADMVRAQAMLIEALGIEDLFLVAGAGMGGMQALNWASAYPKRVFACASIATAARQPAHAAALSEIGRQAIMADPDWRDGLYHGHAVKPSRGLDVARMGADIVTQPAEAIRADAAHRRERFSFRLEGYGGGRMDANSFLYLSRAMDQFDLAADYGGDLANALKDAATRHCVIAFTSDWRYPPAESRALARALIAGGVEASYVEIDSSGGNQAYLGDEPQLEATLTGFVDAAAAARGLSLQAKES